MTTKKKPRCTFEDCNKVIKGEIAYYKTKPYCSACLKRHKYRTHNAKVLEKRRKFVKNLQKESSKNRSERVLQWNQTRRDIRINGNY